MDLQNVLYREECSVACVCADQTCVDITPNKSMLEKKRGGGGGGGGGGRGCNLFKPSLWNCLLHGCGLTNPVVPSKHADQNQFLLQWKLLMHQLPPSPPPLWLIVIIIMS